MPIDQNATVLVTGATGFVGRSLVHQLSALNCHIRVLAREGSVADTLASNYQAELIHGNILSKTAVRSACAGVTHIFHLAGRGQSTANAKYDGATHQVNVEGTKLLAQVAANTPELERFLHLSTIAVHGDITGGPADESAEFSPESTYELTKLEAELWLTDFAANNKLPLTVLRPCAIVGPGDQRLLKLFKLANHRIVTLLGDGSNRYQIIHIDDCIRVMIAAVQTDRAAGETYICGNPETLTLREIVQLIHGAGHTTDARVVSLPVKPLKTLLGAMDKLCATLGITTPMPTARLAFFEKNHWFDTSKMCRDLELGLHHDNESALCTTRDWYIENGWL